MEALQKVCSLKNQNITCRYVFDKNRTWQIWYRVSTKQWSLWPCIQCVLQMNKVTHFIDGSAIYGSNSEQTGELRSFEGGRLRVFQDFGRELPPLSDDSDACLTMERGSACFTTGKQTFCTFLEAYTDQIAWNVRTTFEQDDISVDATYKERRIEIGNKRFDNTML